MEITGVRLIKQLSLEGFELEIEINPEDKKDVSDCAIFFEGEGQAIKDLNRTSEFIASLPKGKYTIYKTGAEHALPMYKGRTDFPFIVQNYNKWKNLGETMLHPTFSKGPYPHLHLQGDGGTQKIRNAKTPFCHRIFAMAFIKCPDLRFTIYVDHINEDKLDYSISNLQWVTASDNRSSLSNTTSNKGKKYGVWERTYI
tara:strand:+ start:224 stop:820 length:597 start_codon:yes stop_codon:yes gene_type:complete